MTRLDPEQERQRLADYYSRQLDGRLEVVAGQAYELTDLAREMLQAELRKRGLLVNLVNERPVLTKDSPTSRNGVILLRRSLVMKTSRRLSGSLIRGRW